MKRTATTWALLVCMVVVLAACQDRPSSKPPPATVTPRLAVAVLTADQPTARIPQPRLLRATGIQLKVQAVRNPGDQGLVIGLAVEDATTVDVGNVSLYPASQPGVFTLVLPGLAADLVHQEPTVLIVTVYPALSGTILQPGVSLNLTAELIRS
jgi:hypothetical protein